jgi:hypothetical protein
MGALLVSVSAQGAGDYGGDGQCTCSGLDYTDGGSYLVDGSSDHDFTFTSVFSGMMARSLSSQVPR